MCLEFEAFVLRYCLEFRYSNFVLPDAMHRRCSSANEQRFRDLICRSWAVSL